MLKGKLVASSDMNVVNQAFISGAKVIYLGDPASIIDPIFKENCVMATSLIPDYPTMSMQVDGNEAGFFQMYTSSLNSKAAIEMIAVILVCLYKGINILLYVPQEAIGLNYAQYLLQFLEYNYGVVTQTKTTEFNFIPSFTSKVMELIYLNNLITAQEFLISSDTLDDMVLRKLVGELHPMVKDPTDLKCIIEWFSNYKNKLLETNKPLINGIQYAGGVNEYACY